MIDTVILRPLPYVHPERIISVESRSRSGYTQPDSWPSFVDERAQSKAFQSLAAYTDASMTMETPSGPVKLKATWSTDNLFSVFGVQPLLGRTYRHGEEEIGRNEVVVLSHDVWQRYFWRAVRRDRQDCAPGRADVYRDWGDAGRFSLSALGGWRDLYAAAV